MPTQKPLPPELDLAARQHAAALIYLKKRYPLAGSTHIPCSDKDSKPSSSIEQHSETIFNEALCFLALIPLVWTLGVAIAGG